MKNFNTAIILMVISGCFTSSCRSEAGGKDEVSVQPRSSLTSQVKAPEFLLRDLDGKEFSLSGLHGHVVFLEFWATWCPPCILSSPYVEQLREEYEDEGLVVVSVSLDQNVEVVQRYVDTRKIKSRVAMAGKSGIEYKYRVSGVPAFYLIDKEGYIIRKWGGYSGRLPSIWRQEIKNLL